MIPELKITKIVCSAVRPVAVVVEGEVEVVVVEVVVVAEEEVVAVVVVVI